MNKAKKLVLGLGVMVLTLGLSGTIASAYKGDPGLQGPNYSVERHTAMEKAFEVNDYSAWKNLMQDQGRVTQIINKDNFAQFAEAHRLAEKGDLEGARKIRQELGLGQKSGSGQGMRGEFRGSAGRGNCTNN